MKMIRVTLAVVASVLLLAACGDDDAEGSGGSDELDGRTFLADLVSEDDAERPLVDGTTLRLEFGDGEVRAHAGCNHLRGAVESTTDGVLVVGALGRTEMGCPPDLEAQDDWLATFLSSSPSWSLDDDELLLANDTAEVTLVDRRIADPDRALEGTIWRIETLIDGTGPDGTATQYPEADAWLLLADGRLDGFTGCNSLAGDYSLDGEVLEVGDISRTDLFCGEDLARAEDQLVAVLTGAEVEVEAGLLWLTGEDVGLGLRADEG